jgi:hypothetical protein
LAGLTICGGYVRGFEEVPVAPANDDSGIYRELGSSRNRGVEFSLSGRAGNGALVYTHNRRVLAELQVDL